jgi:hypothetical protein
VGSRFVALSAVMFLAGCGPTIWVKTGATQQDFDRESYGCEKDARQSGYFGGGLVGQINLQEFINRCMVAHGWSVQQQTPTTASPSSTLTSRTESSGAQPAITTYVACVLPDGSTRVLLPSACDAARGTRESPIRPAGATDLDRLVTCQLNGQRIRTLGADCTKQGGGIVYP